MGNSGGQGKVKNVQNVYLFRKVQKCPLNLKTKTPTSQYIVIGKHLEIRFKNFKIQISSSFGLFRNSGGQLVPNCKN